jgi:hypothetical protein
MVEDVINLIDNNVQIIFQMEQDGMRFNDAIWLSKSEYDITSQSTIDAIKQERFANWLALVLAEVPIEDTPVDTTII